MDHKNLKVSVNGIELKGFDSDELHKSNFELYDLKIRQDVIEEIEKYCKNNDVSMDEVVVMALEQFLNVEFE